VCLVPVGAAFALTFRLPMHDDARRAEPVGDLSIRDPQFRQWWAGHHVAFKRRGARTYNHPVVGEITLDWDTLTSDAEPDQQLIIYTAEPGSQRDVMITTALLIHVSPRW